MKYLLTGVRRLSLLALLTLVAAGWAWSSAQATRATGTLAFVRLNRGGDAVYVVNTDGSRLRNLTDNTRVFDRDPVWSPDGRTIAFTSDRDGNDELYVMNADGSGLRNLNQSRAQDLYPA